MVEKFNVNQTTEIINTESYKWLQFEVASCNNSAAAIVDKRIALRLG